MEHRGRRGSHSPAVPSPKAPELTWCPLTNHPVFDHRGRSEAPAGGGLEWNLAAFHACSSRLYLWDPLQLCVHRLSLRYADSDGDDGSPAIEAACPSEVLLADIHVNLVNYISLNGEGSSLLLAGPGGLLFVMYVYDRVSSKGDSLVCRTVLIGPEAILEQNDGLRIMHVSWHPRSFKHVGILSSDSVLRLYDLSSDLKQPEQEYYLQPSEPGKSDSVVSKSPVAFSFGGEHLWERFSIFILFSDGSVYALCPVVPFGSICSFQTVEEIYEDVNTFGRKSSNARAVTNSWFALAWIEATFPDLLHKASLKDIVPGLKAHAYAPMDASLSLQGPLQRVSHCTGNDDNLSVNCKGKALSFLYNSFGKDSVLVIAWSNGQLQIDALADEIQPLWTPDIAPRIRADCRGCMLGVAMICESNSPETRNANLMLNQGAADSVWLGSPPPLLSLALVDLALPKNALNNVSFSLFPDPIISGRIYCLHNGGIDLITLHFLPFSNVNLGANDSPKAPSVHPIHETYNGGNSRPLISGFVTLVDPFGDSQIIAVTSTYNCILLEVEQWNGRPLFQADLNSLPIRDSDAFADIIKTEILSGPKAVIVSDSDQLRSLSAESIEGRYALHHYLQCFHEHYVKYAHQAYFAIKLGGDHIKNVLDSQHTRLSSINQMLSDFESKQTKLIDRFQRAAKGCMLLERRLQNLRSLPAVKEKPLSRAEREFKMQLERLSGQEMEMLHSSVEALKARLRIFTQSSGSGALTARTVQVKRRPAVDARVSELKSSMEKLSLVNDENAKKVKMIETALKEELDTD